MSMNVETGLAWQEISLLRASEIRYVCSALPVTKLILPLSSKDSVMVGLGREEAAFLKMDSATSLATFTFTTWMRFMRHDLVYRVKVLNSLGDKKQDCFNVETGGNTSYGKWSEHLI